MHSKFGDVPVAMSSEASEHPGRLLSRTSPLYPILRRYTWGIPGMMVLGLAATFVESLGIGLIIPLFSVMLETDTASAGGLFGGVLSRIRSIVPEQYLVAVICLAILLLIFCKGVIQFLNRTFIAWVEGMASFEIREALAKRTLEASYPHLLQQSSARFMTIFGDHSWRTSDALRMACALVSASASTAVFAVMLALVSWQLFIFVAVGVAIIRLIQSVLMKRLEALAAHIPPTNERLAQMMLSIIEHMRLIRIFGQQDYERQRFSQSSDAVRDVVFRVERNFALTEPTMELLHTGLFILVLLAALALSMPVPVMLTFLVLLYRLQPYLLVINGCRAGLVSTQSSVAEVEWLLSIELGDEARPSGKPLPEAIGTVAFNDVSFAYLGGGDVPTLNGLNLSLAPGEVLGVLGRSGAGKSTVVNLICGLLRPTGGTITVGGTDLAEIDLRSWRKRIGIAGQDIELIAGTVADNIRYGLADADSAAIVEAAQLADAADFINALPEGFETPVSDRGISLSGGQRQRIGLARALLRRPDVLVLDEATSAVDGISERVVTALLRKREHFSAAIVISHRLSTLACCSRGVVIENGTVVETGPIDELAFVRRLSTSEAN